MCMAESLHCSPGTVMTLLISYTPIQNKRFKTLICKKLKLITKKGIILIHHTNERKGFHLIMNMPPPKKGKIKCDLCM